MFSDFLTAFWAVRELFWKYSPPPQFLFCPNIQYQYGASSKNRNRNRNSLNKHFTSKTYGDELVFYQIK